MSKCPKCFKENLKPNVVARITDINNMIVKGACCHSCKIFIDLLPLNGICEVYSTDNNLKPDFNHIIGHVRLV